MTAIHSRWIGCPSCRFMREPVEGKRRESKCPNCILSGST